MHRILMLSLSAAVCVLTGLACTLGPSSADGGGVPVTVRAFDETGVGARGQHMKLGAVGAAVAAEQIAATEGLSLVLPEKDLEDVRTAWERRSENPERPIPVSAGEPQATVEAALSSEGADLAAAARWVEGERTIEVALKVPMGDLRAMQLFFRETALRLLAKRFPDRARLQVRLGITLREQGLVRPAIEAYRRAIEIEPSLAAAHYNMGVALDAMGDIPAAVGSYRKAVESDPTHVEAKYNWALDDLRAREEGESRPAFLQRVRQASERLGQVTATAPRNREARHLRVRALEILGSFSEALEECENLQRIFPTDGRGWELEGSILLGLKRYPEAYRAFLKLGEVEPGLITNHYFLAIALEGMGRAEEAASGFERFIESAGDDPKFETARNDARRRLEALRSKGGGDGR
jgi:tetratricopeptide (TPR) repeat protein